MTLAELTRLFKEQGIANAQGEAKMLFSHFGNFTPLDLVGNPSLDTPALLDGVNRRLRHEPLQYIIGEVGFYRETYKVSPHCLIPRSDTEILVEEAIGLLPPGAVFADFCTGSGCIAISVLANRTDTRAHAYDISQGALEIAQTNAAINGVEDRIVFHQTDLLKTPPAPIWDAILANPPYIESGVVKTLSPELSYEPSIALDGGEDGLTFYRSVLTSYKIPLILFEIGYNQKDAIGELAAQHGYRCRIVDDYGKNPRVAILTL